MRCHCALCALIAHDKNPTQWLKNLMIQWLCIRMLFALFFSSFVFNRLKDMYDEKVFFCWNFVIGLICIFCYYCHHRRRRHHVFVSHYLREFSHHFSLSFRTFNIRFSFYIYYMHLCSIYLISKLFFFSSLFPSPSPNGAIFLVGGKLPNENEFPDFQDFDVVHHYLQSNGPKCQARLRKRGQKGNWSYTHTLRRPHVHNQSVETKTQITHRDYMNLLAQRDDAHFTIYKKRRCFLVNNQYFQLDVYKEPSHPR